MTKHTSEPKISYTIKEVTKLTGLGRTRLYEELNSGCLKGVKSGRRTLIPRVSLEKWLENLHAYPANKSEVVK